MHFTGEMQSKPKRGRPPKADKILTEGDGHLTLVEKTTTHVMRPIKVEETTHGVSQTLTRESTELRESSYLSDGKHSFTSNSHYRSRQQEEV